MSAIGADTPRDCLGQRFGPGGPKTCRFREPISVSGEYRQMTIRMDPELYEALGRASAETGWSMAGIVRRLLRSQLGVKP